MNIGEETGEEWFRDSEKVNGNILHDIYTRVCMCVCVYTCDSHIF